MDIEGAILQALAPDDAAVVEDSHVWAAEQKLDHQAVVGALKSLLSDSYVATTDLATSSFEFTAEATQVVANGSPEFLVYQAIQASGAGLSMADLQAAVGKDVAKIGMGNAMRVKWIKKDGQTLLPAVETAPLDTVRQQLQSIQGKNFALSAVDDKVSEYLNLLSITSHVLFLLLSNFLSDIFCLSLF